MLGLHDLPTAAAKVARIRQWFQQEFSYTRYLTIGQARFAKPTAIGVFLTTGKRGHCEYFATAATLLLREAGVPARYCVGYSVMERDMDRNEFVIRGVHGHAWARFWNEERAEWADFDATPPGWLGMETGGETKSTWLADSYQRLKEDFFLWRNRPANRIGATIVMWLLGGGVFVFVGRRLWRSKVKLAVEGGSAVMLGSRTPLHSLERQASRILGPRPPGVTYAAWLGAFQKLVCPQTSSARRSPSTSVSASIPPLHPKRRRPACRHFPRKWRLSLNVQNPPAQHRGNPELRAWRRNLLRIHLPR